MESPGTAPGSEPCIMGAFIAIVRVAPDRANIGLAGWGCKGRPHPDGGTGAQNETARGASPGGREAERVLADQKPDLICSNSFTMRSRIAGSIGVWARSVVEIGSTSAAFNSSSEIWAIATVPVAA